MKINKNKILLKMKEDVHLAQINKKSEKELLEIKNKYHSLLKEYDNRQKDQAHTTMINEGRKFKEIFTKSVCQSNVQDNILRKEAYIYNNNFIPDSFYLKKSLHVKEIKIIEMDITEISSNILMFKNANTLKIADCSLLQDLPDISQMTNLKYLIISKCPLIKKIEIKNSQLINLNIKRCGINNLILDNIKLTDLVINECPKLKKINACNLNELINVDLSNNQIIDIQPLMKFTKIEKLICKNRYRRTLCPIININNDNILIPSNSLIVFIGDNTCNTKQKIKRTVINGISALKNIPIDIKQLKNLKELDLSGNMIEQVPKELKICKKIKQLCLDNNKCV